MNRVYMLQLYSEERESNISLRPSLSQPFSADITRRILAIFSFTGCSPVYAAIAAEMIATMRFLSTTPDSSLRSENTACCIDDFDLLSSNYPGICYTGKFPCRLVGRPSLLVRAISKAFISVGRSKAGSITSSTKPLAAAT